MPVLQVGTSSDLKEEGAGQREPVMIDKWAELGGEADEGGRARWRGDVKGQNRGGQQKNTDRGERNERGSRDETGENQEKMWE